MRTPSARRGLMGIACATVSICIVSVSALGAGASTSATAPPDQDATTSDLSVTTPTTWWVDGGLTPSAITSLAAAREARVAELDFESLTSAGEPRFTVRMVPNTGAYAAPGGWWWYDDLTPAQVRSRLSENGARLLDVEPYETASGPIRFAAVMVANAGSAQRDSTWLQSARAAEVDAALQGRRLLDLDAYRSGGQRRYSAVTVANAGGDAETSQLAIDLSAAGLRSRLDSFGGRLLKLDRRADGRYNAVLVKNDGAGAVAAFSRLDFASVPELIGHAQQLAARPIDIVTYKTGGERRWGAAFIDNAPESARRVRNVLAEGLVDPQTGRILGTFAAYLTQVGGGVKVELNARRRAETGGALASLHLLHAMRRVAAGTDALGSAFTYYEYDSAQGKDACPVPTAETSANRRTNYTLRTGLTEMMRIGDTRTTRGVVLRYGGFGPLNATAVAARLPGTAVRHNIGCGYRNPATGAYEPETRRSTTTAADLARIFEGVWGATLLTPANGARTAFLDAANPSVGAGSALAALVAEEARKTGKQEAAAQFSSLVRRWVKSGSYDTCLPDASGACGQKVIVRASAGLIRLPAKLGGQVTYRTFAFAHLISDVAVDGWDASATASATTAHGRAASELLRAEIRAALRTW